MLLGPDMGCGWISARRRDNRKLIRDIFVPGTKKYLQEMEYDEGRNKADLQHA